MRLRVLLAALAALSVLGAAAPASAAGQACASASVTVNGDTVVDESECVDF
jgi:hypothetical protein